MGVLGLPLLGSGGRCVDLEVALLRLPSISLQSQTTCASPTHCPSFLHDYYQAEGPKESLGTSQSQLLFLDRGNRQLPTPCAGKSRPAASRLGGEPQGGTSEPLPAAPPGWGAVLSAPGLAGSRQSRQRARFTLCLSCNCGNPWIDDSRDVSSIA